MRHTLHLISRGSALWVLSGLIVALSPPLGAQDRPPPLALDCRPLPNAGPHPRDLGLPGALAAADRRELSREGLGYALDWASREPDTSNIPALKRLVELYRCSWGDVALAFFAIEAAGEPSAYFVSYAAEAERDKNLAYRAIDALTVREDASVRDTLRALMAELPDNDWSVPMPQEAFRAYETSFRGTGSFRAQPAASLVAYVATDVRAGGTIVRGAAGRDSLALVENENRSGVVSARRRRLLRELSQAYPTAVEAAIAAEAEALAADLTGRGMRPSRVTLFRDFGSAVAHEAAFPTSALASRPPTVASAAITPLVCVEDRGGQAGYDSDDFAAVLSYTSAETGPVRVLYGPLNEVTGPEGTLAPEVFFPGGPSDSAPGRQTRVAFGPGEMVTWTLLGQTVTASAASPRCPAP